MKKQDIPFRTRFDKNVNALFSPIFIKKNLPLDFIANRLKIITENATCLIGYFLVMDDCIVNQMNSESRVTKLMLRFFIWKKYTFIPVCTALELPHYYEPLLEEFLFLGFTLMKLQRLFDSRRYYRREHEFIHRII